MNKVCPNCGGYTLVPHQLEANFFAKQCTKCEGVWVTIEDYKQWLVQHGEILPEKLPEEGAPVTSTEKTGPKFCPECSYILMMHKVGHGLSFSLNRCAQCGGFWFDKNEWEILKSRNLHDEVHLIFSREWQSAVHAEEHKSD